MVGGLEVRGSLGQVAVAVVAAAVIAGWRQLPRWQLLRVKLRHYL